MVWNLSVPANTFTDADGDILTFSAKMKNGSPLPSWLTFNPNYNVGGAQGRFTGTPENAGVFNGAYEIRLTASDGVAAVNTDFILYIGDASGLPLFVPVYDTQPKISVYDAVAPSSAGICSVMIGLDKPARETVTWRVRTANGTNAFSGSSYTAKGAFVTFQPGEQYTTFDVQLLKGLTTGQKVNVYVSDIGSNKNGTIIRGTGYIIPQVDIDAMAAANTPAVLPTGIVVSTPFALPTCPKTLPGWTKVFDPDFVNDFEATNSGFSASDSSKPVWFSRPGNSSNPMLGREQTGNSEDGFYTDPVVIPGTNPFPLVDTGGGVMKRALRSEFLDGSNGKPASIVSPSIAKTYYYTASMITTRTRFNTIQLGDYVEVRAKMSTALHTWPAIWLLPSNPFTWPPEIDLMEGFWSVVSGDRIMATTHWSSSNKAYGSFFGWDQIVGGTFDLAGWHTWGVWIGPTWITYFVDDIPFMMCPNMPLSIHGPQTWYMLLNIAIGGATGVPNNPQDFPVDFLLDYARVWRKTA